MHVLDTDVVTVLQYPDSERAQELTTWLTARNQPVAVAVTTFEEQVRGRLAECSRAKTPEAYSHATAGWSQILAEYRNRILLPLDDRAVTEFKRLKQLKIRIGTMDLRIASIVLANGATLVSRNLSDFQQVPGLPVEDWTAA